jgi:DNA topoisomerase I
MAQPLRRRLRPPRVTQRVSPVESARSAGLRYVSDEGPGIRRIRAGRGFSYRAPDGSVVRERETLSRIRSLVIPPAWTDVWISPDARGHLQASGRDARGRKQYRYHPRWRTVRDEDKYGRMLAFGGALPAIRARTAEDLSRPGLPREKVLAAVVRLLEATLIRVGNEEYARQNRSFGLTTMRDRHARVTSRSIHFHFRGKSGIQHEIAVVDRRLARVVKRCQELPGQELFQYVDEADVQQSIGSSDVNAYLREISGQDFTAKDLRTWAGTVLAAEALCACEPVDSDAGARHNVVHAIAQVARQLGNTPAICRKCYVHPAVIEAYFEGRTVRATVGEHEQSDGQETGALRPVEAAVLELLEQHHRAADQRARRAG